MKTSIITPIQLKLPTFRATLILCFCSIFIDNARSVLFRLPQCDKFDATFTSMRPNSFLEGATIAKFPEISFDSCMVKCIHYRSCKSMNFGECETPTCLMGTCVLSSAEVEDEGVKVIHMMGWTHIQTPPLREQEQVLIKYTL